MSTRSSIARRRLAAQFLIDRPFERPVDVVQRLGAVQSQDYGGAKWGVAQRTRGATDAEVEAACDAGEILRTHVLRPTWHFVTPADIRWMLALTAPRVKAASGSMYRVLELDDALFRRSNAAIARALRGGVHLTRLELAKALEAAGIGTKAVQRLAYLVMRAELDGVICSGARRGKQSTYALLDERAPAAAPLERDAALHELTMRYVATRGPATAHDLAWWSGLTVADARRGLASAGPALEEETLDGTRYWFTPDAPPEPPARVASRTAHLLPNYDEYFIGHKDRGAIGERANATVRVIPGDAFTGHLVVVDGQLVGGWKRTLKRDAVVVELNLVTPVTDAERRAVAAAAERYGTFLGLPVELTD